MGEYLTFLLVLLFTFYIMLELVLSKAFLYRIETTRKLAPKKKLLVNYS